MSGGIAIVIVIVGYALISYPAYVIGQRRNVENAWVAWIPVLGPTIVMLWSIERPAWLVILGIIPLVNLVFSIWLLVTMPHEHGRTRWWALGLLIPVIGMFWYAFTLPERRTATATA
jgi:uncharacterized membrane protein YhaH (DUF805 family)